MVKHEKIKINKQINKNLQILLTTKQHTLHWSHVIWMCKLWILALQQILSPTEKFWQIFSVWGRTLSYKLIFFTHCDLEWYLSQLHWSHIFLFIYTHIPACVFTQLCSDKICLFQCLYMDCYCLFMWTTKWNAYLKNVPKLSLENGNWIRLFWPLIISFEIHQFKHAIYRIIMIISGLSGYYCW